MNSHRKLQIASFGLLISMAATMGCSISGTLPLMATATPYPTYTPYPTLTPFPQVATPAPAQWDVQVISAIKNRQFGTWSFDANQKAEFLIVTVQYTNMSQEMAEFSPMSVELLFPDGSSSPGSAFSASCYQAEGVSRVTNFVYEAAYITFVKPGETKIEKFAWGLGTSEDTQYRVLFPETQPIAITVGR